MQNRLSKSCFYNSFHYFFLSLFYDIGGLPEAFPPARCERFAGYFSSLSFIFFLMCIMGKRLEVIVFKDFFSSSKLYTFCHSALNC